MCLDLNSSIISSMPPYTTTGGALAPSPTWVANPDPDLYTSWDEFAKQAWWDYQLGEVFIICTARHFDGYPARFHVLEPWLVNVEMGSDGRREYRIGSLDPGPDLLHIRYKSTTSAARGMGPLDAGQTRMVAAGLLQRYASKIIASGGVPYYVITHPEELSERQIADLQTQWFVSRMNNLGMPAVMSGGIGIDRLQFSPAEMMLTEIAQYTDSRIANLLGVPPFLVGLPSGGDSMCVDTDTEILTSRGWRRYDQLVIGEQVYALDMETGLARWEPLLDVQTFDVTDRTMVGIEMQGHSSFSTDDHRWPVKTRAGDVEVRMSRDLRRHDRLIMSAPRSDAPTEAKYSDAFVELVAWVYTEGNIAAGAAWIGQNQRVNPHHCDRIRAALRAYCDSDWSEYRTNGDDRQFRILRRASAEIIDLLGPGKCPPIDFITSLTAAQLELFIAVSVWADGCESGGQITFKQFDADRMESFELACLLAGRSTMRHRGSEVTVRRRNDVVPRDADNRAKWQGRTPIIRREDWTGRVWCPTTPLGTWMARRNGTAYFTHNTYSNVTSLFDYHWRAGLRPKVSPVVHALSQWSLARGTDVEVNRDEYVRPDPY
ncbi:MAG TPA: phage portal protein, partial [Acidimicrobiales bacterium]|nr:phage portal protein [Acidimicrobiales bacterium]